MRPSDDLNEMKKKKKETKNGSVVMRLQYFVGCLDMISVRDRMLQFEWFLTRIDDFDSKRFIAFMSPFLLLFLLLEVVFIKLQEFII